MKDRKYIDREIRDLYEEEAIIKQDLLFKIYNGDIEGGPAKIPFWAGYFLRIKQLWLEKVLSAYAGENLMLLDAGCGPGYLSSAISGGHFRTCGMDLSFNYLKIALHKNKSANFIQADIAHIPFKDKSFDISVCSETLEHLADPEMALAEIKRVTRKLFISTVPVLPKILDDFRLKLQKDRIFAPGKGHLRNYQASSYLATLRSKGFKIKIVRGMGFLWWTCPLFMPKNRRRWGYIDKFDAFFSNLRIFRKLVLDIGVVAEI